MRQNIDNINRILDNLYTRVFKQGPIRQNVRFQKTINTTEAIFLTEIEFGLFPASLGAGKYYGPLTLSGAADSDVDPSKFGMTTTQRVQYGSGLLLTAPNKTTTGWMAFRFRPNWAGGSAGNRTLFFMNSSSGVYAFKVGYDGATSSFYIQRGTSGFSARKLTNHATLSDVTVIVRWSGGTLGVNWSNSANLGGWSTGGSTDLNVWTLPTFDIGSAGAGVEVINGSFYWVAMGVGTLSDTEAEQIHDFGNTDPDWTSFPNFGTIQPVFLWKGEGSAHVPPAVYGEALYT